MLLNLTLSAMFARYFKQLTPYTQHGGTCWDTRFLAKCCRFEDLSGSLVPSAQHMVHFVVPADTSWLDFLSSIYKYLFFITITENKPYFFDMYFHRFKNNTLLVFFNSGILTILNRYKTRYCCYSMRAGAISVLVRNKFLRHGGACDLFCYTEEQVTCKNISLFNNIVFFQVCLI